jgi:hypothetical protein
MGATTISANLDSNIDLDITLFLQAAFDSEANEKSKFKSVCLTKQLQTHAPQRVGLKVPQPMDK